MQVDEYMALGREAQEGSLEGLTEEELLRFGVELFNAGHYWHSHEAWEAVWMDAPTPLRAFYQGLIQVAAGLVHLVRNEYPGTVRLLESGVEKLAPYGASFMGVNLEALMGESKAMRERVIAAGPKGLAGIERESLPRIRWAGGF
jgi:predicted metal-dependent hydrolase